MEGKETKISVLEYLGGGGYKGSKGQLVPQTGRMEFPRDLHKKSPLGAGLTATVTW